MESPFDSSVSCTAHFMQYCKENEEFRLSPGVTAAASLLAQLQISFLFMREGEMVLAHMPPAFLQKVDRDNLRKAFSEARKVEACVETGEPVLGSEGVSIVVYLGFYGGRLGNTGLLQYRFRFTQRDSVPREVEMISGVEGYVKPEALVPA